MFQRTACVAREIAGTRTRRVWRSAAQSGSRPLFGSENVTRTAPLRTVPTRTLLWKRAISEAQAQAC